MNAPEPNATCGDCDAPVIEARAGATSRMLLRPRPAPRGQFAARLAGGVWRARPLVTAPVRLAEGEARFQPHSRDCPGPGGALADVRKAAATQAHQARARRGHPPATTGNPFARAAGIRRTPQ